jgi:hypothetical protein
MLSYLTSRPGRIGAIVLFTLLAGAISTAPALAAAGEGCPNEAIRQQSSVNPTTNEPYSVSLPECRAYEMVSPLEKGGGDISTGYAGRPIGVLPAAADGEAVGFFSTSGFGDAENYLNGTGTAGNPYVASRGTTGWTTRSALPPAAVMGHPDPENAPDGGTSLTTIATCGIRTLVNNITSGTGAACALQEPNGSWLSTPTYLDSNGLPYHGLGTGGHVTYLGASREFEHIFFQSYGGAEDGGAFLADDTSTRNGDGLYEVEGITDGAPVLRLVNVDEDGDEIGPSQETVLGGIANNADSGEAQPCSSSAGSVSSNYQAISEDGSTIFFTACPSNTEGGGEVVYARIDGSRTVAISDPSPSECTVCTAPAASAVYEGASANGSKAFFITTQPLVNGDEEGTGTGNDLYEYDFNNSQDHNLVQLSAGGAGDLTPGAGAEVQGVVRISPDGSHVYFVARGVLTTVPNLSLPDGHQVAEVGADNLYAVDTENEETKFVGDLCSNAEESGVASDANCPATLNGIYAGEAMPTNDQALWGGDSDRQAQTTPDGNYLVFDTYARLITTGPEADTSDAKEVYRYDFQSGKLIRISISHDGFGSNGNALNMNAEIGALPDGVPQEGGDGAMTDINDWGRAISENGATIVFATPEQLQADDVNTGDNPSCESAKAGEPAATGCDVYEWHECTSESCEDDMAGTVDMVSDGQTPVSSDVERGAATLSASGADVFFFTTTKLVGQDADELRDVYDARIDGGFPAPTKETRCSGEMCQGTPSSTPSFGTPGSQAFTGGGNLTPGSTMFPPPVQETKPKPLTRTQKRTNALKLCRKDKRKTKRLSCEKAARKKYGPKAKAKSKK